MPQHLINQIIKSPTLEKLIETRSFRILFKILIQLSVLQLVIYINLIIFSGDKSTVFR